MRLEFSKRGRKAQIAVFAILAIAIVAILLIIFLTDIRLAFTEPVPDIEISTCIQEPVEEALELVLSRGGSIDPELYYLYQDETFEYLCYTREYYDTCIMQKPLLKQSIEREIEAYVQPVVDGCVNDLKDRLRRKGWAVDAAGSNAIDVQIVPDNVKMVLDLKMKIEKDGEKKVYDQFSADFVSKAYSLIMVGSSISNWEAHYGDSAPEVYMGYYHDLIVEKKKQSDGTTLYIIRNINSEETFRFASRSLAWPPGYAA